MVVSDASPPRLPRGRHGLTREQVAADQRTRMLAAMVDAMADKGYVATSVADVIAGAGVSRETFYQQFASKLDCFLAAFAVAEEVVVGAMAEAAAGDGAPADRADRAVTAYLDTLAAEPGVARLFLVEVHAAGPEAIRRRAELQRRVVEDLASRLGLARDADRFTASLVVAGVGALVTLPVVEGDREAIRALREPILATVRRLLG
jgi:AcrR family transcriptional regulator